MGQPFLDETGATFLDETSLPFFLDGPLFFPAFIGLAWPISRTPTWDTLVQRAYSGKKTTIPRRADCIYEYTIDLNVLQIASPADYQQCFGFVNSLQGQFASFYWDDLNDDTATNEVFAAGDGVTTQFQLSRMNGFASDRIQMLRGAAPSIMINGVVQTPGSYTLDNYGVLTFGVAPAANTSISWSGGYYWLCTFTMDKFPFSEMWTQFFEIKKLQFETVIL